MDTNKAGIIETKNEDRRNGRLNALKNIIEIIHAPAYGIGNRTQYLLV